MISGTGRAGTTFLVTLLTHLGLDTGFGIEDTAVPAIARAGLERDIRAADAPHIVKSPYFCDFADEILALPIRIEHAIIPVRLFDAAAASRAHVQKLATGAADGETSVCGGLWDTDQEHKQVGVLRLKFTKLIEALVRHDIPMTFLWYPRLVRDPDYLFAKLKFLLDPIDRTAFRAVFDGIVRPEWTHQFTDSDRYGS